MSFLIKEKLEDIQTRIRTLQYFPKILAVSDAVIKWDKIDLESRKNFETDEILELLLEKLYELYDNQYHSVLSILTGNGIVLGRRGEEYEFANTLESHGLVDIIATNSYVSAQLSIEGKRYVEEKRRAKKNDYTNITEDSDEINQKIDELKEDLEQQGLGQEILFNELEELKELYPKLKNKNWGEILKGKLIDLGLAQVISKKTMSKIFEVLTTEILYLP